MHLNPHVLWATLFIIFAVWFSWFFRFDQFDRDPGFFLDRWTGQLVDTHGKEIERVSLWHDPWEVVGEKRISAAEFLDAPQLWKSAPLGTAPRELTDAEVFGPFADLIPRASDAELDSFLRAPNSPPPPGFVLERKK